MSGVETGILMNLGDVNGVDERRVLECCIGDRFRSARTPVKASMSEGSSRAES